MRNFVTVSVCKNRYCGRMMGGNRDSSMMQRDAQMANGEAVSVGAKWGIFWKPVPVQKKQ
jgi:hypothetical protein